MPMTFSAYAVCSTALVCAVAYQAHAARLQFYPTAIHLTTSKLSQFVLVNEALRTPRRSSRTPRNYVKGPTPALLI